MAKLLINSTVDGKKIATVDDLNAKVEKNANITAGTATKITYDAKGLVTSGESLSASDIPALDADKITTGALNLARLPSLPASKVTSGAFEDARIPTNIERNTNKVSTFQTTPTDTNYPTEKLVKSSLDLKATVVNLNAHTTDKTNPHVVTKTQVGLSNVDNTSDANKPISTATQTALNTKAPTSHATSATTYGVGTTTIYGHVRVDSTLSGTSVNPVQNKVVKAELDAKALNADLTSHATSKTNPHSVTKAQVGLGDVNNTSDANKPVSNATVSYVATREAAIVGFVDSAIQSAIQDTWGGSY